MTPQELLPHVPRLVDYQLRALEAGHRAGAADPPPPARGAGRRAERDGLERAWAEGLGHRCPRPILG